MRRIQLESLVINDSSVYIFYFNLELNAILFIVLYAKEILWVSRVKEGGINVSIVKL